MAIKLIEAIYYRIKTVDFTNYYFLILFLTIYMYYEMCILISDLNYFNIL